MLRNWGRRAPEIYEGGEEMWYKHMIMESWVWDIYTS